MVKARALACLLAMLWVNVATAANWNPQSVDAFGPSFVARNVFFTDSQVGWIVGADVVDELSGIHDPRIWATTDAGANWTQQASGNNGDLFGVHFIDSQVGWVSGRDNGQRSTRWTTDGGNTWNLVSHTGSGFMVDVSAPNANNVWAVGDAQQVRYSSDGGQTWSNQTLSGFDGSQVWNVEMLSSSTGYAAATDGRVYKTTDGGSLWSQVFAAPATTYAMQFLDEQTGFIGGPNMFARTTDGGLNWTAINLPISGQIDTNSLYFLNDQEGWALIGGGLTPAIYHTTDAGDSWSLQYQFENDIFIGAINFSDPNTGWAVGENSLPPSLMSSFGPSLMSFSLDSGFSSFILQFDPNAPGIENGSLTPEPSGLALLSFGLLALYRRRKQVPSGA